MKRKPPECQGCPLYQDGLGFVPDELVEGAPVLILAQNPGADEEKGQRVTGYSAGHAVYEDCPPAPLIGKTGYEMVTTYFPIAGLERGRNVSLCNLLKCRWIKGTRRTNDMPAGTTLAAAVAHCTGAHLRIPEYTRLVVAMGAHAWRYMGGSGSVSDWRGFLR